MTTNDAWKTLINGVTKYLEAAWGGLNPKPVLNDTTEQEFTWIVDHPPKGPRVPGLQRW